MSKFFLNKSQITGDRAVLTGQDVNHIVRVLRAGPGDALLLCDSEGTDYEARILTADRESITAELLRSYPCLNEPKTQVTLFQGLPKQGKMEWIIEKCTEMGVGTIVPVQMDRSVVRLTPEQAEKKLERWRKTAESAAKQCGRGRIPDVRMPVTVPQLAGEVLPDFLLLPYEAERAKPIRQALVGQKAASAGIFIGPEGGFSPEEVRLLQSLGAHTVTLGRRILRTETAGLAALTVLFYEWDEMTC